MGLDRGVAALGDDGVCDEVSGPADHPEEPGTAGAIGVGEEQARLPSCYEELGWVL